MPERRDPVVSRYRAGMTDAEFNALPFHRQLGIVPYTHLQATTDYISGYVGTEKIINNHLYRVPVSLSSI